LYDLSPVKCVFVSTLDAAHLQNIMLVGMLVSYFTIFYIGLYLVINYQALKDFLFSFIFKNYKNAAVVVDRATRPKIYIMRPSRSKEDGD